MGATLFPDIMTAHRALYMARKPNINTITMKFVITMI